jgi:putative flippase GtrA
MATLSKTKGEIIKFGVVGSVSVVVDFAVYTLLQRFGMPGAFAKGISFFCGAAIGFTINKLWTFSSKAVSAVKTELPKYILLYSITAFINSLVNLFALNVLASMEISENLAYILAFLSATGVSMALNFLGLKFFVFRRANRGT